MINALFNSIKSLVTKPWLILPALIVSAISAIISSFTTEAYVHLSLELLFFNNLFQISLIELPIRLFEMYPSEITTLIGVFVLTFFLNLIVLLFYAKFVKEEINKKKTSFSELMQFSFSKITQVIALFFLFVLIATFFISLYLFILIVFPLTIFSWIVILLLLLLAIYITIKLLFAVPALADIEKVSASGRKVRRASGGIKSALQKSWEFSNKHLFGIIILLIILFFIIGGATTLIMQTIETFIEEDFAIFISFALLSIVGAFTNLSICYYYFQNKK